MAAKALIWLKNILSVRFRTVGLQTPDPVGAGSTTVHLPFSEAGLHKFNVKPNGLTAVNSLAETLEHCNEWHPHSALDYRSPREFLLCRTHNRKCLKI